ncbi:hypothetical protein ZTR_07820 [Talaromyces verruculosus]|nr:hypothetical protein ZTR_07820 [Talaromyces verruculosus]
MIESKFQENHRRRRAPNQLVWTQPRTISPSLHKQTEKVSPLSREASNKDTRIRRTPVQDKQQQTSNPRSYPSSGHTKHVLDWNETELFDLGGTFDMANDITSAPSPAKGISILDAAALPTPQSMNPQQYAMQVDDNYLGSLMSNFTDDSAEDGSNSYMTEGPSDSSTNSNRLNGFSALHLAAYLGKASVIRLLLSACPDAVDVTNSDGETPLHIAATEGRFEAVVELLRAGANTLLQDVDGRTVLHIAVCKEHVDLVHLLLDGHHGQTLIRISDSAGKTPLHQAVMQGCDQIVQIFLAKGADPRMTIGKSSGDSKLDAERANFFNGIMTSTNNVSANQQPDNLNTVK